MSLLVDTSVWIAFFRDHSSPISRRFAELVGRDRDAILGCPVVRLELSLDSDDLRRRHILRVYDGFPTTGIEASDFELAGDLYRAVRQRGHTIRALSDCLIAAAALRCDATIIHTDVDFDRLSATLPRLSMRRLD